MAACDHHVEGCQVVTELQGLVLSTWKVFTRVDLQILQPHCYLLACTTLGAAMAAL